MKLTLKDGEFLVKTARKTVEYFLDGKRINLKNVPEKFKEDRGVFVTIETYPEHQLRGCIGFPRPTGALISNLIEAAISAATRDYRFPSIEKEELDSLIFEVTVLTKPELIKVSAPEEYLKKIKVGRDGLIVEYSGVSGLLLPQVPIEWNWDVKEFLENTCIKAGLNKDAWKEKEVKIYKFQGQIFAEKSPKGEVIEKALGH